MSVKDCLQEAVKVISESDTITEEMKEEIRAGISRVLDDPENQLTPETKLARSIALAKEYRKDAFHSAVTKKIDEAKQQQLKEMVANLPEDQKLSGLRNYVESYYSLTTSNEQSYGSVSNFVRGEEQVATGKAWQVWDAIQGRTKLLATYKDTPMAKMLHKEMLGIETGNKQAKDLAKQMKDIFDEYKERLRNAGVYIEDRDGFFPQSTGLSKLNADEGGWTDYMRENLDPTMHPNPDATATWVKNTLATRHLESPDQATLSMSRKLHWRTPEAEAEYFYRFGEHESVSHALWEHLRAMGRKTALAESLGPSAEKNLTEIKKGASETISKRIREVEAARHRGEEGAKKKREQLRSEQYHGFALEGIKESLTGEMHNPASQNIANWGSAMRDWAVTQMLGKVGLSILGTDALNSVFQTKFHAGGFGKAALQQMKGVKDVVGNENIRAIAKKNGLWTPAVGASAVQRYGTSFQSSESTRGFSRKAAEVTQRIAGVYSMDNALRGASMLTITKNMMDATKTNWGDLRPEYQRVLKQNGFDEAKWKRFQKEAVSEEGTNAVNVQALPKDLRDLTLSFLYREMDSAVIHPQHFDRALMTMGSEAGTPAGEISATVTQFMSWPTTFFRNAAVRQASMGGSHAVGFAGGMIAAGVLTTQLYELAEDRPMFEMDSPELWKRSLSRSGLLSPVGEIAMKAASDRGFNVGGPASDMFFTGIQDVSSATGELIDGRTDQAAGQIVRVLDDVALPNTFWLQYSLISRGMEAAMWELDPQYQADKERRMLKQERM